MSEKQIEGVPEGWRLVRIGRAKSGDWVLNNLGKPLQKEYDTVYKNYCIIEKIEQQKQYRPFANEKEFEPHRDRWWRYKDKSNGSHQTTSYSDRLHMGCDWISSFYGKVFDDGSPFGVEVTE